MVVGTSRGRTTQGTADCARLTLEAIITFLTTSQATTLLLEVGHTDSRKGRCSMVLRLVVMDFMDRNSSVND